MFANKTRRSPQRKDNSIDLAIFIMANINTHFNVVWLLDCYDCVIVKCMVQLKYCTVFQIECDFNDNCKNHFV